MSEKIEMRVHLIQLLYKKKRSVKFQLVLNSNSQAYISLLNLYTSMYIAHVFSDGHLCYSLCQPLYYNSMHPTQLHHMSRGLCFVCVYMCPENFGIGLDSI